MNVNYARFVRDVEFNEDELDLLMAVLNHVKNTEGILEQAICRSEDTKKKINLQFEAWSKEEMDETLANLIERITETFSNM